jgi:predicted methyltransferase MtxX (methanogen marker protein 4)
MEDTEVSDSVLLVKKWLLVRGVSTLEGLAVISDMRLPQVGRLVTSCDAAAAAGPVISDVITSDIVTVTANEVIISDTVTVKVVVFSSGIVGDKS